ncbi:MAG: preprotein translocase subunit SecG [Opitutaceae bacterium]|nr:preprotein translocase subunit SecG [Opitutaceae bacterium]
MSILIGILTFILILLSVFLILIVLAQKAKNDGGMGAAMGGGMAEAAFGADTSNVLSKATINSAIAFFVLAFVLYLAHIHQRKVSLEGGALPAIPASVSPAPTKSAPVATSQPAPKVALPATPVPAPARKP